MQTKKTSTSKILFVILLLSITQFVSAQYEDLQKNKNISWIAEFSNDYSFSLNASNRDELVKLTKFSGDASNFSNTNQNNWLVDWMLNNAKDGRYNCYSDAALTQSLSIEEIKNIVTYRDTVVSIDTKTYTEKISIIEAEYTAKELAGLKVNQVIFYNKKRNRFNTRVVSVAPILVKKIKASRKSKKKKKIVTPLFWMKMDGKLPKKFKVNSSDVNWAALVFSKNESMDLNSIKVIKNNSGFDVKNRLYEQAVKFEKPILRSYDDNDKLNTEDLKSIYTVVDTVVTFSPDTYEEVTKFVKKELKAEDIFKIRLVQEWYFDRKRKVLMNRLKAINPMIDAKAGERNYTVLRPLYFIKYD